jgi:hypothetical protein
VEILFCVVSRFLLVAWRLASAVIADAFVLILIMALNYPYWARQTAGRN